MLIKHKPSSPSPLQMARPPTQHATPSCATRRTARRSSKCVRHLPLLASRTRALGSSATCGRTKRSTPSRTPTGSTTRNGAARRSAGSGMSAQAGRCRCKILRPPHSRQRSRRTTTPPARVAAAAFASVYPRGPLGVGVCAYGFG